MTGDEVLARVSAALAAAELGAVVFDPALRARGAYAVVIGLAAPVRFARRATGAALLGGWLVYAGSAMGPGGIGARVARHLRRDKAVRWHVDALTGAADWLGALAVPGGDECAVVRALLADGGFGIALDGFGSSDCRSCDAHLLRVIEPGAS